MALVINWENYSFSEILTIIDHIVGMALMYGETNNPAGEFTKDVGGGGFVFSLCITWQRAFARNRIKMTNIMKDVIDECDMWSKLEALKKRNPDAENLCGKYLKEKGIAIVFK